MTSNSFSPATLIGFNKTIAALRSISIVLVVLFHLRIPGFSGGFIGVDIFFVISGFLMTRQVLKGFLEGKNKRLQIVANFYGNRIRRLFPLAMFWIFSTLFLSFVFSKAYFDRTIVDAIASLMFLMNFRLIENANDYFDSKLSPSLLQHFWTLSVEMQLYIVLPIVFILVFSLFKGNVWRQRTVAVAAAFLCVISLMLQITTDQFVTNYYDTLLRMFPFFSGACLAILRNFRKPNYPNHGFSRFISILCFLGIGILQLTSINSANYLGGFSTVIVLLSLLPIWFSVEESDSALYYSYKNQSSHWLIIFLSSRAYAIYLGHYPIILVTEQRLQGTLPSLWIKIIQLLLILVAAEISYRYVESRFYAQKFTQRSPRKTRLKARRIVYANSLFIACLLAINLFTSTRSVSNETNRSWDESTTPITLAYEDLLQDWFRTLNKSAKANQIPPTLDIKLEDIWEFRRSSWANCFDLTPEKPYCKTGDVGAKKKVVVIGDSFAFALTPAIESSYEGENVQIFQFTRRECPFADLTPKSWDSEKIDLECVIYREKALELIKEIKPKAVFVAEQAYHPNLESSGQNEKIQISSWIVSLEKNIKEISPYTERIYVSELPSYARSLPDCVTNLSTLFPDCWAPINKFSSWNQALNNFAQMQKRVEIIPLNKWLCTPVKCPPIINDQIVFIDGVHLAEPFARTLGNLLRSYRISKEYTTSRN